MNRIEARLEALKAEGKKAFITYMTAGLPSMEGTVEIIKTQAAAGVDIIELGVPFSDPVADGPVIQAASYKSILKGTSLKGVFEAVKEVRKDCDIPIVFMMYYNTVMYYGVDAFVKKCAEVGVDGVIIPDLPFEEQDEIKAAMADTKDAPIMIELVSPVSKDRVPTLLENARGFVYCVSSMGVTGQSATFHKNISEYLKSVKAVSKIPVMMGFGIRTPQDVEPFKDIIDGCIVGSHFIKLMEENDYSLEAVSDYIKSFKAGF